MWKRSRMWSACPAFFAMTCKYGFHMFAADEGEGGRALLPEPAEEPEQGLGPSVLTDPQQPLARRINLVDQGEKVRAVLPVDFIDAERANSGEIHVIVAPGDGHVDRAKDLVPTGAEHGRHLFPTEALGPAGQKPHVGGRELVLALGPGHVLDAHAARRARDAAHHVEKEHRHAPQRHKFEAPRSEPVVMDAPLAASRAARPIPRMRIDVDCEREAVALILEPHVAVHKSPVLLNPIQDSLDLHPAVRLQDMVCVGTAILSESTRDASSIAAPELRVEAAGSVDAQNASTDPCKTTERFCTSFHTPHRRVPFSEERKTKTSQNQSATHRFCGGGRLSKGIPHVAEWFNEPIGIDLRRLRTRMMHYAYTKTCGSPGWVVEPTKSAFTGSRELNDYSASAADYATRLSA